MKTKTYIALITIFSFFNTSICNARVKSICRIFLENYGYEKTSTEKESLYGWIFFHNGGLHSKYKVNLKYWQLLQSTEPHDDVMTILAGITDLELEAVLSDLQLLNPEELRSLVSDPKDFIAFVLKSKEKHGLENKWLIYEKTVIKEAEYRGTLALEKKLRIKGIETEYVPTEKGELNQANISGFLRVLRVQEDTKLKKANLDSPILRTPGFNRLLLELEEKGVAVGIDTQHESLNTLHFYYYVPEALEGRFKYLILIPSYARVRDFNHEVVHMENEFSGTNDAPMLARHGENMRVNPLARALYETALDLLEGYDELSATAQDIRELLPFKIISFQMFWRIQYRAKFHVRVALGKILLEPKNAAHYAELIYATGIERALPWLLFLSSAAALGYYGTTFVLSNL